MDDTSKSIWNRPWTGLLGLFLWFAVAASVAFVTLLCFAGKGLVHFTSGAFAVAIGIVMAVMLAVRPIRRLCHWLKPRRLFFVLACVTTSIALFYAEEDLRGKWAWEKHKRECEAKGEKFDLGSLAPPPVPDEQNLALIPLLKPIFAYTRMGHAVEGRNTNGQKYLEYLTAWAFVPGSTNTTPALGNLDRGSFADLEACADFYRGNTNYPQPTAPGTAAADILVALGRFDPEMNELRTAAVSRPFCRFPVEYGADMPAAINLPHLSRIKAVSILCAVRATALLALARPEEALADMKLSLRFSDSIREEPFLISHLVRLAILSIDLQILREGLARHAWTDAQLAELEQYLGPMDLLGEYKHGLRGERACGVGTIDWVRRQGFKFNMATVIGADEHSSTLTRSLNFVPGGWLYQNLLTISRLHQDFVLDTVDPQAHRVFPDLMVRGELACQKMRTTPCNVLAKLLFPSLTKACIRCARTQTYVDAARIACALECCRRANGQLPDTLDALVPRFINKLPNDVVDGRPLRYHKSPDGGYVVYSVGWNQTDDGGELGWTSEKKTAVDPEKGDWVWQIPGRSGVME